MAQRARPSVCRNGSPIPNARKNALRLLAAQLISPCLSVFFRAGRHFFVPFSRFFSFLGPGLGSGLRLGIICVSGSPPSPAGLVLSTGWLLPSLTSRKRIFLGPKCLSLLNVPHKFCSGCLNPCVACEEPRIKQSFHENIQNELISKATMNP